MSKKYEAVLFDLDGTLLPMDNDLFIKVYFKLLFNTISPLGYEENKFYFAMKKGVEAMVKNDGSVLNYNAFWVAFSKIMGDEPYKNVSEFDSFYTTEFRKAKAYTYPTPLSRRAVEAARRIADKVVLATNPMFPPIAVTERMSWTGLMPEDFDLITNYENSSYCKPNPMYYVEIGNKLGLDLSKCLMVGNNTVEDIKAGSDAGMDAYLITDWIISDGGACECKKGSFAELVEYLEGLDKQ